MFTYQTRIFLTEEQDKLLSEYANHYGHIQRCLFRDISKGLDPDKIKSFYLIKFGITARQFNSLFIELKGKIASIKEHRKGLISNLEAKIKYLTKILKKITNRFSLHQKKRKLFSLKNRLSILKKYQDSGKVRLCIGTKKLFHAQYNLEENGYDSHGGWLKDWRTVRSDDFFVVGATAESSGNQSCTVNLNDVGSFSFRLRLMNCQSEKYTQIDNVTFEYGQEQLLSALESGTAITYRFKKDDKGWRIFVSAEIPKPSIKTDIRLGAIGFDINSDCIALSEINRHGNWVTSKVYPLVTYGISANQATALIGDVIKQITDYALSVRKPIVIEKLDFSDKKQALKEQSPKYARMLSSLAYNKIKVMLKAACFRKGIEVIEVNPAYSSVIGQVNYSARYGISVHESAALVLARRALGFSERPTVKSTKVLVHGKDHVTFFLPVRNRKKHVWSFWSDVRKGLRVAHVGHPRLGYRPTPSSPLKTDDGSILGITGAIPVREPLPTLFG